MRILVAVKRVADFSAPVRVRPDGSGVDLDHVRMAMNPFDEIALEEALRLREAGRAAELVVASVGTAAAEDVLRTALAMGADRAVHIALDAVPEPLHVARLLAVLARREEPGLILLGKQAVDDDAGQVGPMLAALLGRPQGSFASRLELADGFALVTREVDSGSVTVRLALPAVVTADLRLNEPRYVSLPGIMKAKRQPIERLAAAELGVDLSPGLAVLRTAAPPARKAGIRVASAAELAARLRDAGVVP